MQIEHKLLSKLSSSSDVLECWDKGLREQCFSDPQLREVYRFIADFWRQNHMELIPTREILLYEYPSLLLEDPDDEVPLSWLVESIQKRYAANQAQELMVSAAETIHEDPIGSLTTLWRESYRSTQLVAPRYDQVDISENKEERRLRYQQRLDNHGLGLPYGLTELDDHTHGLLPGELAVASAYSKTGKSFFLAHVAVALRKLGFTPIVFTLELLKTEMEDRIDAFASGVSYDRLIHSQLSFEEMNQLRRGQDLLEDLGPLYVHRPREGDRTVTEMVGRARQLKADYILIDQLSWMDSERKYSGERADTMKHGDIIRELRNEISNDSVGKIPCLLAVQQGRSSMEGQKRPEMWKIANSSNIEQTVDIALGLSRTPQMRVNNAVRLDIMGSRRSDLKSWLLNWHLINRTEISVLEEIDE